LLRFFDDPDKDVREAAGHCFSQIEDEPLENFAELIEAYCFVNAARQTSFVPAAIHSSDEL
jgi:hypothetical protein